MSEDDGSITSIHEEDEEEGFDEVTSREAPPKQVREPMSVLLCLFFPSASTS